MKTRGMGRVYQQRGSVNWWLQYSNHGTVIRESSGSSNRAVAIKLLKQQLGKVAAGKLVGPQIEKTTFDDLAAIITNEYAANERASLKRLRHSLAHLRRFFGDDRALTITSDRVTKYIAERREEGAANATINRELAALKRAFQLARIAGKVVQRPHIAMLTESNARSGFFEREQFEAVLDQLPDYLRPVMHAAYMTGWRVPSELLTRQRHHLDLNTGVLRLDPGEAKNREGRVFPIAALPELRALLEEQVEYTRDFEKAGGQIIPWLFHHNGRQIKNYYTAWGSALKRAGIAGRIAHDFRRTAVRNLERAGVSRSVAMKLTGHRTEAVYRRYAIVSESDLSEGIAKLAALHEAEKLAPPSSNGRVLPLKKREELA